MALGFMLTPIEILIKVTFSVKLSIFMDLRGAVLNNYDFFGGTIFSLLSLGGFSELFYEQNPKF